MRARAYDVGMTRRPAQRAFALARATHPGPTVAVTVVAFLLALGAGLEPWRVALVTAVILFNQLSIGLSNDWIDAERDRASERSDKPVAAGDIDSAIARTGAIVAVVASVALSVPLGWGALVSNLIFIAAGWAYNAGLKSTVFSVIPYLVGFSALPLVVSLSAAQPQLASPWIVLAGGLLGAAAHGANVLPDLDDDRATGVLGLPHRIGARATGVLIALSLVGATASVVLGFGLPGVLPVVGLVANVAIAVTCVVVVFVKPSSAWGFRLIILAALIAVALLAVAGPLA